MSSVIYFFSPLSKRKLFLVIFYEKIYMYIRLCISDIFIIKLRLSTLRHMWFSRLLTDFVCLLNYEFWLSLWKIALCSVMLLLPLFNTVWLSCWGHLIILLQKLCLFILHSNPLTLSHLLVTVIPEAHRTY